MPVLLAVLALAAPQPAVREEVRGTFPTARSVVVVCRRTGRTKYVCSWSDRNGPGRATDYFGRARVTVDAYGADARLYRVRCHYCRSGPPPRSLL